MTTFDTVSNAWAVLLVSLVLVAIAVGVSRWLGMGVEGRVLWASIRAAVQLMAVGVLLTAIVESKWQNPLAWIWVAAMVAIASRTILKRVDADLPSLGVAAAVAVGGSVGVSLAVTFGLGIFDYTPINVVVVAGITIGNALPSAVLAVNQVKKSAKSKIGEIEALLALGFDRTSVGKQLAPSAAKSALIPQVERTKVVGLIALPGAMVGLLLAGTSPMEAVLVQLLIMYLVLGSVAISVLSVVATLARQTVTPDLRAAEWIKPSPGDDGF